MKKLITILMFLSLAVVGFGQLLAPKGIKIGTGAAAQTALNLTSTADYIIEKVGSTYYVRPGIGTGLTAYSGVNFSTVLMSAMGQLTTGGVIFIKAGLYDNLDIIKVPYSYITLQGVNGLTKLKLKASADIGVTYGLGLINISNDAIAGSPPVNYITIKDIELDGNGANQTLIDNGAGTTAKLNGIYSDSHATTNLTVTNCYIHDFTQFGVYLLNASDGLINYNKFEHIYWNAITIAGGSKIDIEHNYIHGSGDVGITSYGADVEITNNFINGMDGVHGSDNASWGIGLEGGSVLRNKITNNIITACVYGIMNGDVNSFCEISNNTIYSLLTGWGKAIYIGNASNTLVAHNKIHDNTESDGIFVGGNSIYTSVFSNDIYHTGKAIEVSSSTYNTIEGNVGTSSGSQGLYINNGGNYTYVINNIFKGANSDNNDIRDVGITGNVFKSNYQVQKAAWFPETGLLSNVATATADGLTTGIITPGSQNLTVSSNVNDVYIISLPAASVTSIGTRITGLLVGAKICELRVQAAQATTVYINNVTTNVEAALPAACNFEVTQVDATHWILKAWTALGAVITAIVPDAV